MKTGMGYFLALCYQALLRLYPADFRRVFAAEMRQVFAEGLAEAAAWGWASLLAFIVRELVDLPAALLDAHRSAEALRRQAATSALPPYPNQMSASTLADPPRPGSWSAAALAAFPHLVWGIVIALGKLDQVIFSRPTLESMGYLYTPLAISLFLLTAGVLMIAWARGWRFCSKPMRSFCVSIRAQADWLPASTRRHNRPGHTGPPPCSAC